MRLRRTTLCVSRIFSKTRGKKNGWKTNFQHVYFHLYLTTNECVLKNVLNQLLFSRYFRNDEYSIVTEIALKTDL